MDADVAAVAALLNPIAPTITAESLAADVGAAPSLFAGKTL